MYDPGPIPARDVLALVNEIPRAFFRLSAIADDLFADLGVGGPERGVLRDLFVDGEGSAPEFARRKAVSRQAVQATLDGLVRKGLVRTEVNPRHKRSMHYVLTKVGIETCVEMQRRELEKISTLMNAAVPVDYAAAAAAVAALNALLAADLDARSSA
jgi:DNA-binding MarR family transcriptional regulator